MQRVAIAALTFVPVAFGRGRADWPSGPIRWLVGFAPGGTADMISRDIAGDLEKVLGQPVIIENRPGANGATATAALVAAKPDGQTLMMILSGHITNAFLYPNLGFDPLKDVAPVSLVASSPLAIVANPNFAPSDIKSLVEAAKAKPDTISYATPGVASIQQLSLELMAYMTGTKFVHVPYRGGAPALNDAIGGHVPLAVLSVLQVMPQVEAKQLKAARGDVERAHRCVAERAVDRGGRRAGLRGRAVVRRDRAARNARRDRRPAQPRDHPLHQVGRDEGAPRRAGRARDRLVARGVPEFMRGEQDKWGKVLNEIKIKPE